LGNLGNNERVADPIVYVEQRIAAAFAKVAGSKADGIDTAVRSSDRADAQVNGSIALAKAMGLTPRDVAAKVLEVADLEDICRVHQFNFSERIFVARTDVVERE
jgi:arginyl-tRNA synthetase